uniref:hypothetical protein n=1 Tax=Flavobacterium sp. TaxID=239 RepID=UPI004048968C
MKTIKAGLDGKYPTRPDLISRNLFHAVNFIVNSFDFYRTFIESLLDNIGGERYIFIGGLSMSGKSTLASLIKHYMGKRGKNAHVVDLEHFYLGDHLDNTSVSKSYIAKKLHGMLNTLQKGASYRYRDFGFDRLTHRIIEFGEADIFGDDIVIMDGSISADLFDPSDFPGVRVFVNSTVDFRYQRFVDKHNAAEFSSKEIEKMWSNKKNKEDILISRDIINADFVFDNPTF